MRVAADHLARNRRYWDRVLDPQNLSESSIPPPTLRGELPHWDTTEQRWALRRLEPLHDRRVLDLGGGLGVGALALAKRGARVVLVDLSEKRADAARRSLIHERMADKVQVVVAAAEHLPFRPEVFDRSTTKSVLIHTDLPRAAREIHRVLKPGGRAVFLEPLDAHPLIWIYRTLFAPKTWKHITRYFNNRRLETLLDAFGGGEEAVVSEGGGAERESREPAGTPEAPRGRGPLARRRAAGGTAPDIRVRFFYFLGAASALFAYGRYRNRGLRRLTESLLDPLDAWLFRRFPGLRWRSWFLGIKITRSTRRT